MAQKWHIYALSFYLVGAVLYSHQQQQSHVSNHFGVSYKNNIWGCEHELNLEFVTFVVILRQREHSLNIQ